MSLIIATGSNLGDKKSHLKSAKVLISKHFNLIAQSQIYSSPAVDYLDQPDFFNQVLEFEQPKSMSPTDVMTLLLSLEKELGRRRDIPKGPRTVDIDIIFFGLKEINTDLLQVPHPRCFERSFVILPLTELPYYQVLKSHFSFTHNFSNAAKPIVF
jgi:2-amino-4-hydroxy-6-hydroxymethyldihydropteridine diphosphokinase